MWEAYTEREGKFTAAPCRTIRGEVRNGAVFGTRAEVVYRTRGKVRHGDVHGTGGQVRGGAAHGTGHKVRGIGVHGMGGHTHGGECTELG